MTFFLIIFQTIAVLTIIPTVLALFYNKSWWIRVCDFPRLQIIFFQAVAIIGLLVFMQDFDIANVILTGITFFALVTQIIYVFPYLSIVKKEVPDYNDKDGLRFSLMVSNVLMSNRKSQKLIELVRHYQPSIFLAVETDQWWKEQLDVLDEHYTFRKKVPIDNTYGMLLFSKLPLTNLSVEYIIEAGVPSIHADVVLDESFVFKLRCIHPEPPAPSEADTSRPRDRELVLLAKKIKQNPAPYIVIGDLNDVAWSDTSYKFERISELKDPRKGRGFYNTFNAKLPFFRWALDHVFMSELFEVIKLKRLPFVNSDHFPVYLEVGVNPTKKDGFNLV